MSNQPNEDIATEDVMRLMEISGTLDFWNNPEEDIYEEANQTNNITKKLNEL